MNKPVTACLAVASAKAGAETMPKPKKTASFFYFTEWLQHFLIRSKLLLPDDFHQYALAPVAVKFAVENLFPWAEVQFSLRDGHDDLATL